MPDETLQDDTRTFEQVKAEQDAYCTEAAKVAEPGGYAEWVRTQVDEAIRDCEQVDEEVIGQRLRPTHLEPLGGCA
ncbi:MAG: hypothetical protein ACRYF4_13075 [Janthinobacterium lividum]